MATTEIKQYLNRIQEKEMERVSSNGWDTGWAHRGVYLHLESSELIEAIRGKIKNRTYDVQKKSSPIVSEGADVLSCLLTLLKSNDVSFNSIIEELEERSIKLDYGND